jgi:hypothetical protein
MYLVSTCYFHNETDGNWEVSEIMNGKAGEGRNLDDRFEIVVVR